MANVGIYARLGSQVRMLQMALTTGGSDYVLVSVWLPGPGIRLSRLRLPLDPTVGAKVRSHTRARLALLVSQVRTLYDYDADGVLTTLTPPAQEPWQFAFTTVPGDSGKGRLAAVSRSALAAGIAVSTVVYRVPVSGSGAPWDLSSGQTVRWGQTEAPTDAAAVFPPTQVPTVDQSSGVLPSSYEYASVTYLDANGRSVNTVAPGGGIDTAWYDVYGHPVRMLTAGNRSRALDASASDSVGAEAVLASTLSTIDTYSADGQRLLSTLGPEHDVALAAGGVVRGRAATVYTYDEGAPAGGPFDLVTTTAVSVRYTGPGGTPVDADTRTSTTGYDWDLSRAGGGDGGSGRVGVGHPDRV